MTPPGLIISAPASGTGKTTLMLGLLSAFRAQGITVQPFKTGPDYIDPAFHAAASGRPSVNLDSWAMTQARIAGLVGAAEGADLILAEGSMGLFDGVAKAGETGSGASADIAALMGWPVVLVIDVSGQAQSAAAVAAGFATYRPDVRLVYLKGDYDLIAGRMAARAHHYMPVGLLQSQFDALEEPGPEENAIVVPVDLRPDEIVAKIIRTTQAEDLP